MTDDKNTPEGKRAALKYADIINGHRPESKRVKMDLTNRAKIFSPYDALRGFDEAIEDTGEKVRRVQKVLLSEEEKAAVSTSLQKLQKGLPVSVTYFMADPDGLGHYRTASGTVIKIDTIGQKIEIAEKEPDRTAGKLEKVLPTVIRFSDLLNISL